ncbi:MAG: hypothetical protein R3D00_19305 [Bacteroidia bacterium]
MESPQPHITPLRSQVLYGLYIALLFFPCLEAALWILGFRPYRQVAYSIESSPANCILPHAELGFGLNPGTYEVTINHGLKYTVSHGEDSLRITTYKLRAEASPDSVYFLGCSFTYGMGVSDSLTFPFLVNQYLPNTYTKNLGVPGYGTVQAYLQIRRLIAQREIPGTIILNYADFHDARNSLTPAYRRDLYMGYQRSDSLVQTRMHGSRIPYLSQENTNVHFCKWEDLYQNWEYRETFASVNFLQDLRDQSQRRAIDARANTIQLFSMIKALCNEAHIRLVVTGITHSAETKKMLALLEKSGIETLDISVDLSLKEYTNAPFDDHPNAVAHEIYAKKIIDFLLP